LLPAGAVAGWDLHPLENAALSRRTPEADICCSAFLLRAIIRDAEEENDHLERMVTTAVLVTVPIAIATYSAIL
jgi:hypothetical protein